MRFHRVQPNTHYRSLRLMSEDGSWELGMSPYSQGMRLRMGRAGQPPRVMDFCLGRDESLFSEVLIAVLRKLEPLAEISSAESIDSVFPWNGTRPDMAAHLNLLLASNAEIIPRNTH